MGFVVPTYELQTSFLMSQNSSLGSILLRVAGKSQPKIQKSSFNLFKGLCQFSEYLGDVKENVVTQ